MDGIGCCCCNKSSPVKLVDATVQDCSNGSPCDKAIASAKDSFDNSASGEAAVVKMEFMPEEEDDVCCCCKKSDGGVELVVTASASVKDSSGNSTSGEAAVVQDVEEDDG